MPASSSWEGSTRWKVALASAWANVALVVLLAWSWSQRRAAEGSAAGSVAAREAGATRDGASPDALRARWVGRRAASAAGHDGAEATPTFWSSLMSTNLSETAARLRSAGCPPETICDILVAQARRDPRSTRRWGPESTNFWQMGDARRAQRSAREEAFAALVEERDRTMRECGCLEMVDASSTKSQVVLRIVDMVGGILPLERRRALLAIKQEADRIRGRWSMAERNGLLPEDLEALKAASRSLRDRVDTVISHAELDELSRRVAVGVEIGPASRDVEAFAAVKGTPEELRSLAMVLGFDGSQKLLDLLTARDVLEDRAASDASMTAAAERAAVRSVLGQERGDEFLLRRDGSFEEVQAWQREYRLAAGVEREVYRECTRMEQDVAMLRRSGSEPNAAMRRRYQELHDAARTRLAALLAGVPAEKLDDRMEDWLLVASERGWEDGGR